MTPHSTPPPSTQWVGWGATLEFQIETPIFYFEIWFIKNININVLSRKIDSTIVLDYKKNSSECLNNFFTCIFLFVRVLGHNEVLHLYIYQYATLNNAEKKKVNWI